jgi:hypothetical protein
LEVGNLVDLLNDPAGQHPDNLAAVSGTLRLSSAELSHREVHADVAVQSREAQHLRAMLTGDEPWSSVATTLPHTRSPTWCALSRLFR